MADALLEDRAERILVLDDDAGFLDMVSRAWTRPDRAVVACAGIAEARAALRSGPFDLAVIDLFLGGRELGYDFVGELRAAPLTQETPAVAVSGSPHADFERCYELGFDTALYKPFESCEARDAFARARQNRAHAAVLRGARVLHLEDEDGWGGLVAAWLGEFGAEALRVRSRRELAAYAGPAPEAVLVDLGLPDADGLGVLDEIKRSQTLQSAPVVALSGRSDARREALRHGAVACVEKNGDARTDLLVTLATVLDQHRRSQGLVTSGALIFDPRSGVVRWRGALAAVLTGRPLCLFSLLVKNGAAGVSDDELRDAVRQRAGRGDKSRAVHNYVSELRQIIGPGLAAHLTRKPEGRYRLRVPGSLL